MGLLPIALADDPVIRQKSKKVRNVDASLQKLVDDMLETMEAARGVGLAAPQVGILRRVAVIRIPEDAEEGREEQLYVLVNPEIIRRSGERQVEEGCLSIPGWRGLVTRSEVVTVKALNRQGKEYRINKATGLLAQALEHEIDHLNGVLYIDHLVSPDSLWKIQPKRQAQEEEEEEERAEPRVAEVVPSGL